MMGPPMFAPNTTTPIGVNVYVNGSAHMAGKFLSQKEYFVEWIVDTEASNNMISEHTYLLNEGLIENARQVQLPIGDSARVSHGGNCHLRGGPLVWNGEGDW